LIPAAAVAMGAKVIEKHFTLDRKLEGPDHSFALEPKELAEMVKNIRDVEKSMGSPIKKPVPFEAKKEQLITRGMMAIKPIKKGEAFSGKNLITVRTGKGSILPKNFYSVLGKKAKRDIDMYEPLTQKDA